MNRPWTPTRETTWHQDGWPARSRDHRLGFGDWAGQAIEFAREGVAGIVVHYLHDRAGGALTCKEATRWAVLVHADIGDEAEVAAMFDDAVTAFGAIDILMNNAGVDASGTDVADLATEVWDKAIRTNVYFAFFAAGASSSCAAPPPVGARSSTSSRSTRRSPTPGARTTTAPSLGGAVPNGRLDSRSPVASAEFSPCAYGSGLLGFRGPTVRG